VDAGCLLWRALDDCCVCPSDETQMAATAAIFLTSSFPFSGPSKSSVVDRASDAVPVLATALTANCVLTGTPLSGSMMWPADSRPSRLGGVCSEVETLLSDNMTWGSTLFDGSLRCTNQPVCSGGAPIATIVLPPASSKAREMPCERNTSAARSRA